MTVKIFRWPVLKNKIFLLYFSLLGLDLEAQTWFPTDSLRLQSAISAVSSDASGNLYLAEKEGQLSRYSSQFQKQESYSNPQFSMISTLDAEQMLRIFTFYRETQQFQFFNRFLTPLQPPANFLLGGTSQVGAAAMSSDQMIWLIDEANLRLLKYNPILENVMITTDLTYYIDGSLNVKNLQEHNNRLFLHQQDEMLVFDFMGNFISKLPPKIEGPSAFYGQKLYYCHDEQLFVHHLESMRTTFTGININKEVSFILCTGEKLFLVLDDNVIAYKKIK